jgi:hypothetical protein
MTIQDTASALALIKQELEPLAQKIGQGADYTFGLFVRQVYVNALQELLFIPFGIFLIFGGKWLLKKDEYGGYKFDIGPFLACIAFLIAAFLILAPIADLIAALVNPQYQAIQLIINTFKTVK